MIRTEVDATATAIATEKFGLPPCLHVPIAALDVDTLERYVGRIMRVLAPGDPQKAVCLRVSQREVVNPRLPIWQLTESVVLHRQTQVWVHVDYTRYRRAYAAAFPDESLHDRVIDHVLNRHVARLKGFQYLRVVPISKAANSSSGGLSEKWSITYHAAEAAEGRDPRSGAVIQYADLADIVKLLDMKTGGTLQDPVNDAQHLIQEG